MEVGGEAMSVLTQEEIQKAANAAIAGSGGILDENKVIGAIQWAQLARVQTNLLGASWKGDT